MGRGVENRTSGREAASVDGSGDSTVIWEQGIGIAPDDALRPVPDRMSEAGKRPRVFHGGGFVLERGQLKQGGTTGT